MLSKTLENSIKRALTIAGDYKHEFATYEHLLLALLHDKDVSSTLLKNNVDLIELSDNLEDYLANDLVSFVNLESKAARPTSGFQKLVQKAAIHSHAVGRDVVTGTDLLTELFFYKETKATKLLQEIGLSRNIILQSIEDNLPKNKGEFGEDAVKNDLQKLDAYAENARNAFGILSQKSAAEPAAEVKQDQGQKSPLNLYCANLNDKAREGFVDLLIGRDREIDRTIEILSRRQKNNPLLVGEPGVGKTAIAEGLAYRIVKGEVPEILKNFQIYSLDIGSLISGTKYRGDFEERFKNLISEIKAQKNIIFFIDEIHTIVGAGSTTTASLDASNLIKPALARGEIRCMGATTFKEFNQHFAKDQALVRRFQKIVVEEPSLEATIKILMGLKPYYEKHHNVKYTDQAIEAAVNLSERYIHDRQLPDKAIDLIDEAGASMKIDPDPKKDNIVDETDIEHLIAKILNIPSVTIASDDVSKLKKLEFNLNRLIFGQEEAISNLCASIKMSMAGLRDFNKPVGCYLFAGPTGTGKTELAKQLANLCSMELIRFDMSEYMEPHSISRLIGSPPGYSGYDQGGLLTDALEKAPYSVILFDEIEKAHSDVFNLLLQIMDYGKLTDTVGKTVNFSHAIIIMTSNSGADQYNKHKLGFGEDVKFASNQAIGLLESNFSPEFRDRLDKIIMFNPLNDEMINKIIEKTMKELAEQLADKHVRIEVDHSVQEILVDKCFKRLPGGARMLEKAVDEEIKKRIAEEILFGKLSKGGLAKIKYEDGAMHFTFRSKEKVSA